MTATTSTGARTGASPTGAVPAVAALTVVAMTLLLPVAFFTSYAFVEEVGWSEHAHFLRWVGLGVLVVGAVSAPFVRRGGSWTRALVGSPLVSLSVVLAAGAAYAVLNLLPALDVAVGAGASDAQCLVLAVALALAAGTALRRGGRLLAPVVVRRPEPRAW